MQMRRRKTESSQRAHVMTRTSLSHSFFLSPRSLTAFAAPAVGLQHMLKRLRHWAARGTRNAGSQQQQGPPRTRVGLGLIGMHSGLKGVKSRATCLGGMQCFSHSFARPVCLLCAALDAVHAPALGGRHQTISHHVVWQARFVG